MDENEPLLRQLVEFARELDAENIPVVLGGGMSLYLRRMSFSERIPRYPTRKSCAALTHPRYSPGSRLSDGSAASTFSRASMRFASSAPSSKR